jgi:mRNA-degrading endonuclease RelE of RelBE toxin-antitoxin system
VNWTVVLRASAQRDLRRLDRPVAGRIVDALTRLAATGQADVTRLQGSAEEWRLRVEDWRIRFRDDHPTRTLEGLRILPGGAGVPLR